MKVKFWDTAPHFCGLQFMSRIAELGAQAVG